LGTVVGCAIPRLIYPSYAPSRPSARTTAYRNMEGFESAQRNNNISGGGGVSPFVTQREDRVRARNYDAMMRQLVVGVRAFSMVPSGPPRSSTISPLQQQPQHQQAAANVLSSPNHSPRDAFLPCTPINSPSEGRQQMSEGGYRDAFSSFSPNYSSLNGAPLQVSEGGFGDRSSHFSPNNASLNESRQQMADDGFGDSFSLSESLRSPGQFGRDVDWAPQTGRPTREYFGTAPRHTERRTSIEFMPVHPPSSFPLIECRPRARGDASYAPSSAPSRQAPRFTQQPQPLLELQMYPGGLGIAPVLAPIGQGLVASPPFGSRSVRWADQPADALINSVPQFVRNQWLMDQKAPPDRRARPTTTANNNNNTSSSSSRRHASVSSNDSSLGSSRGSSGTATDCSYCLSVCKPHYGHNKYHCPVLAALPACRLCNAFGKDNHTESHCPLSKTELTFVPKEKRSRSFSI
ncbi:hypothetical protein PMAYCL1PPCAC_05321, partial [Pristionchus mayeri]